jgi:hypothetical protein
MPLPFRVQNIFNQLFQPPALNSMPQATPEMPGINEQQLLKDLLTLNSQSDEDLGQHLNMQPRREDYKPSRMTDILARVGGLSEAGPAAYSGGAALGYRGAGAKGVELTNAIRDKGFNEATADWEARLKPLSAQAAVERGDNTNRRIAGTSILREIRADEDRKSRDRNAANTLAQRDRYLAFKYFQEQNPDFEYEADSSGYVYGINPKTNKVMYVTGPDGSKIKSHELPDAEQLRIRHQNTLKEIDRRVAGDIAVEEVKQPNRIEAIQERTKGQVEVKGTTPAIDPNRASQSPSQQGIARYNKAEEARNTHPAWADYIVLNSGRTFDLVLPKRGDPGVLEKIKEYIYGFPTSGSVGPNGLQVTPKEPPKGAKPGGRWISTPYGAVYQAPE